MRLLLNDAFAAAPIVYPVSAGWLDPREGVETPVVHDLRADVIGPEDAALVPVAEVAHLQTSHQIVPDVAVVAGNAGTIAMRCPVRPDEIGITPVRLWEVNGTAELLARATLRAFYGIHASAWTREDDAETEVVIVDGAAAVQPPEAGFSEDLCRAWVILTSFRAVDHVLVAPRVADRNALQPVLRFLTAARELGRERRRELRRAIAEPYGLDRDRLAAVQNEFTFALGQDERRSLLLLLQRGLPGSSYPPLRDVVFLPDSAGEG